MEFFSYSMRFIATQLQVASDNLQVIVSNKSIMLQCKGDNCLLSEMQCRLYCLDFGEQTKNI